MPLRERRFHIPTPLGTAPACVLESDHRQSKGVILVYHGLGAEKEVQRKEMAWLSDAGFTAVGVDAPHHGERNDGTLQSLAKKTDAEAHPLFIGIVREAIREIPAIVEHCLQNFTPNVGITGISLGGFIAYGAAVAEPRLKASAPILGSPDWSFRKGRRASSEMKKLLEHAPVRFPEKFSPCALFAANAGKDLSVPPQASRQFLATLQKEYSACPERLKYMEYPESGHMMREEDWNDLWRQVISWFDRFLT